MKFDKHAPSDRLKPYIKCFVVSEIEAENEYKVFPSVGIVVGFQYRGQLSIKENNKVIPLDSAGVTGISKSFKTFRNSSRIGTILVYFTETGFLHFATHPANELFNLSLSLSDIFDKKSIDRVEEKLQSATSDKDRVAIVELFLLSHLNNTEVDKLILESIRLIYQRKGAIRIKELNERLCISQSPFEKRFRKIVGTTPKKFASIVRFNSIIENLNSYKTLTELCYENDFFDQAHFNKEFKHYTGETPDNFRRFL